MEIPNSWMVYKGKPLWLRKPPNDAKILESFWFPSAGRSLGALGHRRWAWTMRGWCIDPSDCDGSENGDTPQMIVSMGLMRNWWYQIFRQRLRYCSEFERTQSISEAPQKSWRSQDAKKRNICRWPQLWRVKTSCNPVLRLCQTCFLATLSGWFTE